MATSITSLLLNSARNIALVNLAGFFAKKGSSNLFQAITKKDIYMLMSFFI